MKNIEPWCISRQIWWGHRIPAWYDDNNNIFVAENERDAFNLAKKKNKNNGTIYLNIILNETIEKSVKKLYVGNENVFKSLDLSEFIDNQTQVMIKQTDRIYKLIIDPNVEIFIR